MVRERPLPPAGLPPRVRCSAEGPARLSSSLCGPSARLLALTWSIMLVRFGERCRELWELWEL